VAEGYVGQTGGLILKESLGFLECKVTAEYPGGDHTIFIGQVINGGLKEAMGGPLVYYGGKFTQLCPP
jgi:flavin reductase (DIM6/NTAB) family NADH-FMN oxidoreductase RutF